MTFAEAIKQATLNERVARPHWCFVELMYDHQLTKTFIVDEGYESGDKRTEYKPTKDDLSATDWVVL